MKITFGETARVVRTFFFYVVGKNYESFKLLLFGVRFPKRFYFIFIFLPPEFYSAK